ncbi:MAG TPA: hypothetical protein VMV10_26760 [Pirellulales bacterium]|nr:hypothetical protein [Pirellulales bacterium]
MKPYPRKNIREPDNIIPAMSGSHLADRRAALRQLGALAAVAAAPALRTSTCSSR